MGFPKCDGCCTITAAELNYMFDPYDIKASMLENSVNVTKLNYKYSLQDITHDYMVVDVFTDSTGYNNTIQTCLTTSTYCCSNLNGYYLSNHINYPIITGCKYYECIICGTDGLICCNATTDFGINQLIFNVKCGQYIVSNCSCNSSPIFCFDENVCKIIFNACFCHKWTRICGGGGCNYYGLKINEQCICWNACTTSALVNGNGECNISCSICYINACNGCWDYYIGDTCICQIYELNTCYPIITMLCSITNPSNCVSGGFYNCPCSCITFSYICACGKIVTSSILWSCPIHTTYLSLENYGTGSIEYNVIDGSTGCYIACNLLPNTTYSLCDSVCCHIYEIIQCNDGVSCIKSYAILAGHA